MNASAPHKVSLVIIALAVIALLGPYAGCNGLESGSDPSSTSFEDPELGIPSRRSLTTEGVSPAERPIDPIEEILSN